MISLGENKRSEAGECVAQIGRARGHHGLRSKVKVVYNKILSVCYRCMYAMRLYNLILSVCYRCMYAMRYPSS